MNDEKNSGENLYNVEELIIQQIHAADRTTRAVRAFVRFLFIQLVAITFALFVLALAEITQDPSDCRLGICPPNEGAQIFAGLIWLAGVVWSSRAGWSELSSSEIPALPVRRRPTEIPADIGNVSKHKASLLDVVAEREARIESKARATQKRGQFCAHCGARLDRFDSNCKTCGSLLPD